MADRIETPLDRTDRDGAAGKGDMLGGTNAGAGDRLGIDEEADRRPGDPGSLGGHQHTFDDVEPRTDSATTVHTAANLPPANGA
jgi:hypothetical protein